jgi:phage replication O-like protein O
MLLNSYTQINNEFIANMAKYGECEIKIFLAISRKTIGWHKISDRISYSQLEKATGLATNSIKKGITNLIIDKWIIQTKTKNGFIYDLNMDGLSNCDISKNDIDNNTTVSKFDTVRLKTISKFDTTKDININKEYKEKGQAQFNPQKISPTFEVWKEYAISKNYTFDIEATYGHYMQNGWKQARGNKIIDWRYAQVTCQKFEKNKVPSSQSQKSKPQKTFQQMQANIYYDSLTFEEQIDYIRRNSKLPPEQVEINIKKMIEQKKIEGQNEI